jgi:tRNA A-37 threonylcarbamoyl transferase component Bud32
MDGSRGPELADVMARLQTQRVARIDWDGATVYAKRIERTRLRDRVTMIVLAPFMRRLFARGEVFNPVKRPSEVPFEVQRLTELRKAGVHVPALLAANEQTFVMESSGRSLSDVISEFDRGSARADLLLMAARDLAAFHAQGQWHGGAQLRNMGISDRGITRFDFEADYDRYLPLSLLQAMDAVLFITSLAGYESEPVLLEVIQTYFRAAPAPVLKILARGRKLVRFLAGSRLIGKLGPKEAVRVRLMSRALDSLVPG